ncbi:MAG: sigma-70 family RNA polymerase sigma factor [Pirellulales bacterium]
MVRRRDPDEPVPWANLLNQVILWSKAPPEESVHWIERWQFYEENPYYLARVDDCCRIYLGRKGRSDDWLDYMQMEVRELFGHELSKHPDLGIDFTRIQETFPAWLDGVITRLCGKAYSRLCRRYARRQTQGLPPPRRPRVADPHQALDLCSDIEWALQRLGGQCESLLRMYSNHPIREIARQQNMPRSTLKKRIKRCRNKLRRILKDYEDDDQR